jgi:holo-[acyl-carrier protein] synthase
MPEERAIFDANRRPVRFLAMRFAAKEAIAKALGTGFRNGVWIRDFGFMANAWGRPEVRFSQRGRAVADRLGAGEGHVSLTDEAGLVMAFAVLLRKA